MEIEGQGMFTAAELNWTGLNCRSVQFNSVNKQPVDTIYKDL